MSKSISSCLILLLSLLLLRNHRHSSLEVLDAARVHLQLLIFHFVGSSFLLKLSVFLLYQDLGGLQLN